MTMVNPNLYQLHGQNLNIVYSMSGFDGKGHFSYQDTHQSLQFTGDQIRILKTEIGILVTVYIKLTVDTGSTTFSLLVPSVYLDQNQQSVNINTLGITTLHRSSIVPVLNKGQTEQYHVTTLTGTAQIVDF